MTPLEITEEAFLTEDLLQADEDVFTEAWPVPREDLIREFENYLLDIGVRI